MLHYFLIFPLLLLFFFGSKVIAADELAVGEFGAAKQCEVRVRLLGEALSKKKAPQLKGFADNVTSSSMEEHVRNLSSRKDHHSLASGKQLLRLGQQGSFSLAPPRGIARIE